MTKAKWLCVVRWTVAAGLLGASACTLLLDRDPAQCHSDEDCAKHFPARPTCDTKNNVCVRSGLGPPDCFFGTPQKERDFLNACSLNWLPGRTASECLAFDNCLGAGICKDSSSDPDAGLMTPMASPPSPANPDAGIGPVQRSLPSCRDPSANRGSVVYLTGSSNFPPLLAELAPTVNRLTGLTPVFLTTDSCTGARSMYPVYPNDHFIKDPAPGTNGNVAQYFDATGGHDCTLGPSPVAVDVGESEIFPETCGIAPDLVHVYQFPGPILPILFVVPNASEAKSISAEAARQVFGNGGVLANGQKILPWNEPSFYFVRGSGTATTRLVGLAIDVPVVGAVPQNKFWGVDQGSAQKLAQNVALINEQGTAQKVIGILGSDYYDQNRAALKALAFQATEQECAYTPDSNSNLVAGVKDKINVRDGHYPIWGTLHFFAAAEGGGGLVSPAAAAFVEPFTRPPISEDLIDAFIDASWIPDCAMMVQRDDELGQMLNHPPRFPCNCHFDTRVLEKVNPTAEPPHGCKSCILDSECVDPAKPACNFHFCEPRFM